MWEIYLVLGACSYTLAGVAIVSILSRRRQPEAAVLWIFLVLILPVVGVLSYFLFGRGRMYRKRALRLSASRKRFDSILANHYADAAADFSLPLPEHLQEMFGGHFLRLTQALSCNPWVGGNCVELLIDAPATYARMFEAIDGAQDHVHVQFYIFRLDATGERFLEVLRRAAERGVEVRLLYDAIGSYSLKKKHLARIVEAGVEAAEFHPTNPLKRRFEINFRNHRKNLIIDGKECFVGGLNVGDEYLGIGIKHEHWRDTHVFCQGPVARQLQEVFLDDWYFATDVALVAERYLSGVNPCGIVPAQVVSSGPDNTLGALRDVFFAVFTGVRKSLDICVPYFLPDDALLSALLLAARRDVKVRVLLPFWTDHVIVRTASKTFYHELLRAGAELYEYEGGLMHAKTVVADGLWCSVGSCNLDPRSLVSNFETNLCFLDQTLARTLTDNFEADLRKSSQVKIEDVQQWPLLTQVLQNFYALFSPLL